MERDGIGDTGYRAADFPLSFSRILSVNYYDDYSFLELPFHAPGRDSLAYGFSEVEDSVAYGKRYVKRGIPGISAYGLLTGRKSYLLEDETGLLSTFYYDGQDNVVQSRCQNLSGGYEKDFYGYTFSGQPLTHMHVHSAPGKPTVCEEYEYVYDDRQGDNPERLRQVFHRLNGGERVHLEAYEYDALGRLSGKSLHGDGLDKLSYRYNIRGWLAGISGSGFSQQLHYTDGPGVPCYNGNISSMTWQTSGEDSLRGYKFVYDDIDRLVSASYGEGNELSNNADGFTETVSGYDLNGNILGLQRYGQLSSGGYGLLDDLTYMLHGNQLRRVDDAASAIASDRNIDFRDAVKQADEYAYDKNGNLTKDLNRNIIDIQYNFLNLPCKVVFAGGDSITYVYAADGTKLRSTATVGGVTTTTDYCGNVIYENGVRKLLLTEAGYVTLADGKYHYYLQDHQGNNRVVVDEDGTVEEVNHYYPFGGVFASSANVQPYKYNGKELEKPQQWYDYGARRYDAVLGRFTSQDPLAEKAYPWSPYAYCYDNPVLHVDPTGEFASPIFDLNGNLLGTDDEGLTGDAIFMNKDEFKQGMSHEEALRNDLGYESLLDELARNTFQSVFDDLKDRPDYDGYLTLSEANDWYRNGDGKPLFVDVSKIDLSPVTIDDLRRDEVIYYNYFHPKHPNLMTGLVYGTLGITLLDDLGSVRIGSKNGMIDTYDFDYQEGRFFRNVATKIGHFVAGKGIGYNIFGYGFGKVSHAVNRPFGSRRWFM